MCRPSCPYHRVTNGAIVACVQNQRLANNDWRRSTGRSGKPVGEVLTLCGLAGGSKASDFG